MEKALCKKDYDYPNVGLSFKKGEVYEVVELTENTSLRRFIVKNDKTSLSYPEKDYLDKFYLPDETMNVLRTELIDKILC